MLKVTNCFNEIVGEIVDDTYITHRRPEHFMIKYHGFGISEDVLKQLEMMKISKIVIMYIGKQSTVKYFSTTSQYLNSVKTHVFKSNGKEDLQKFVSIKDYMIEEK